MEAFGLLKVPTEVPSLTVIFYILLLLYLTDHVVGDVRIFVLGNKARIFGVTVRIFAVGSAGYQH